jgi:uncharacterized membrane protein (DUF485 family)
LQVRSPKHETNIGFGILMLSYSVVVTAVYVFNKNPIFHEVKKPLFEMKRFFISFFRQFFIPKRRGE